MRRLYEAADRIEAQRLIDFLQSRGISTVLFGDYLAGAAGELPANLFPAVWLIDAGDEPQARDLLREFLQAPGAGGGNPWICPCCREASDGGFELCWQCGTPRP